MASISSIHSATKFIGGHGTSIGGLIVDSGKFDYAASGRFTGFTEPDPSYHGSALRRPGRAGLHPQGACAVTARHWACLSPFNAFMLLQGIETLGLRMERHCSNAKAVAQVLPGASKGQMGQLSWAYRITVLRTRTTLSTKRSGRLARLRY